MATKKQLLTQQKRPAKGRPIFRIKVIIHPAAEGGYWAEVPALPGCHSQGETLDEVTGNIREAIRGCLSADVKNVEVTDRDIVEEIDL